MTVLFHISDTHGLPQRPIRWAKKPPGLVVHTGDMMPNVKSTLRRRIKPFEQVHHEDYYRNEERIDEEVDYQSRWMQKVALSWRDWLTIADVDGADVLLPFLYMPGNHDYIDPTPYLRDVGVDAVNLLVETGKGERAKFEKAGVSFGGAPLIVEMGGIWNHESTEVDIAFALDRVLDAKVDVLVSHGPPHGILDIVVGHGLIGSRAIEVLLEKTPNRPKAHLFGHNHPCGGVVYVDEATDILFSNAAATRGHTIDLDNMPKPGKTEKRS